MMRQGRGPGADTLASIRGLHVSVDLSALMAGTVKLPSLVLDKPRIFAKNYADGSANWNIFRLPAAKEKDDSTASEPLEFALGRIVLRRRTCVLRSHRRYPHQPEGVHTGHLPARRGQCYT